MSFMFYMHELPAPSIGAVDEAGDTILTPFYTNPLFDAVQPATAQAGRTDYRVLYIRCLADSLLGLKMYIASQTSSPDTSAQIGLGAKAIFTGPTAGTGAIAVPKASCETKIASITTAPAGVSFVDAASLGAAILLGDMTVGQLKAVWVKRVINAGAAAVASDVMTLRVTNGVA